MNISKMISKGQLWYIPHNVLGIEGCEWQMYKVQIFIICSDNTNVLVEVKHYKTKKCNKVHVKLSKKVITEKGILYTS